MRHYVGSAYFILMMFAASHEAFAGYVNSYSDWMAMSEVEQKAYIRGMFDGRDVYVKGDAAQNAYVSGVEECANSISLRDKMIADAVTEHYKSNPSEWPHGPVVSFIGIVRSACLDFINKARRDSGLEEWKP